MKETLRRLVISAVRGMATTAVCGIVVRGMLFVAWAGDSRCYLYSDGTLHRLTHDHSIVQELIDSGLLTCQEARHHPLNHTITRYLGQVDGFEPQACICLVKPGDLIVMCSDGLTDVLADSNMVSIIEKYQSNGTCLDDLAVGLVQCALNAGTRDNVTVLCCEYQPSGHRKSTATNQTVTDDYPQMVAARYLSRNGIPNQCQEL